MSEVLKHRKQKTVLHVSSHQSVAIFEDEVLNLTPSTSLHMTTMPDFNIINWQLKQSDVDGRNRSNILTDVFNGCGDQISNGSVAVYKPKVFSWLFGNKRQK